MVRKVLLVSVLTMAAPVFATPTDMLLVCSGSSIGQMPESQSSGQVSDNYGNRVSGKFSTSRTVEIPLTIQLRIEGEEATLNLPRFAAPEVSSSNGGWYRVKNLDVSDTRIRGKVVFNFLSSSRFEVDRLTGIMTSEAGFQGACEKADVTTPKF